MLGISDFPPARLHQALYSAKPFLPTQVTGLLTDRSFIISCCLGLSIHFFPHFPIQFQHWYHFLQLTILSLIWHCHSWRETIMSLCWCGFKQKASCGNTQSGKISNIYTCPLSRVVLSGHWGETWEEGRTREAHWDPRNWLSWEPAGITVWAIQNAD